MKRLLWQYSILFSLIEDWSLMFAGDFSDVAALDLELSTHAVNVDYKKALHDWSFKTGLYVYSE
jgi:iron complex outermembrane receptor protein